MLGALALVAVRQQQGEPRREPPLGQPGAQELVDDDLRAVDEVAELRLPEHQRLGRRRAVAVLEAQGGELAQRAVVQLERRERAGQPLHRREPLAGGGVVQHQVALAERAALGVLPGEPDRHAFGEQRGERQRLGVRPVDAALGPQRRAPPLELLAELGVHREALGPAEQLLVERDEELGRERGVHLEPGSRRLVLRLGRRSPAHAGLEALLDVHQPLVGLGRLAVGLLLR